MDGPEPEAVVLFSTDALGALPKPLEVVIKEISLLMDMDMLGLDAAWMVWL